MDSNNNFYIYRFYHAMYLLRLLGNYHKNKPLAVAKRHQRKQMWVRSIFLQRKRQGDFHNLIAEMRLTDTSKFFNYLRMTPSQFDLLLHKIGPLIVKNDYFRETISPAERLSLTLRYLASGDSMTSMSYSFRVGLTTVSSIINECCGAIWVILRDEVLRLPTEEEWDEISQGFFQKWQMPNCLGALDGKHVNIQAPPNCGSQFFNYKKTHSLILLALCDYQYKFLLVDIGAQGRQSDGGVLRNSEMGKKLYRNELNFPADKPIINDGESLPHFIVGDEAFPLTRQIMRPYPGNFLSQEKRIFNYRLSRARRVSENSFGILVARWRILRRSIIASLDTVEKIIQATVCLHNFIMNTKELRQLYCPATFVDQEDKNGNHINGAWRQEIGFQNLESIHRAGTNNNTRNAAYIRNNLAKYFMLEGAISFQWDK